MMGGGSANLAPHHETSLLDALRTKLGDAVDVQFERGVDIDRTTAPLYAPFEIEYFAGPDPSGEPVAQRSLPQRQAARRRPAPGRGRVGRLLVPRHRDLRPRRDRHAHVRAGADGRAGADPPRRRGAARRRGRPARTRHRVLRVRQRRGASRRSSWSRARRSRSWSSSRSRPTRSSCAGIKARPPPPVAARPARPRHRRRRGGRRGDRDGRHQRRLGDRGRGPRLHGPPRSAGRARRARAVAANPNTVVVVNTGSPVTMDWADDAPAIVQAWFGGQEMGNALADVLFGDAEPGGRLPTTFPVRLEHNPSYGNFPGEFGELRYGEGVLAGVPLVRGAPPADAVPVRPRALVLDVRDRRARRCAVDGDAVTVQRPGHQHRRPPRRRGGAVLRRAAARRATVHAPAEGAEGVRQGVARPGRVDDRRAHARRARVRVLAIPIDRRRGDWSSPGTYELHVGRSSADIAHVCQWSVSRAVTRPRS